MENSLNISEMFESIQGEGPNIGKPAIFLRLSKCVLNCIFCDTKNIMNEGREITFEQLDSYFKQMCWWDKLSKSHILVITGGSPLLQQNNLIEWLSIIKHGRFINYIELENECVISVKSELTYHIDQFNNSIKLSNSGIKESIRIKPQVIKKFISMKQNNIWKFVITDNRQLKEVQQLQKEFDIPTKLIYLMPEGKDRKTIIKNSPDVINMCLTHGYNYCPREHIMIWNTKKGV